MREIGGYFQLDQLISNEYYTNLIRLNSGRNALLYILNTKKYQKIHLPYFICDSVKDVCKNNGYNISFYHTDSNFMPIFNRDLNENEVLYIVNYYGQLTSDIVRKFKLQFKQIILDNTHAFFQRPENDVDTIYTCRKYFGVPDGAYLSTNVEIPINLEKGTSASRMAHILGRYEGAASNYYSHFQKAEDSINQEDIKSMSNLSHNLLGAIDYEKTIRIRNINYEYLNSMLSSFNKLKLNTPKGPFAYPLYVDNGIKLREFLAKRKIYIPTLWPNVLEEMDESTIEYKFAANIIPLPCDQRYNIEDINRVISNITSYVTL